MPGGYMGKILIVDLTREVFTEEMPGEKMYREFIGGYGLGAKIIFDRQPAGADPLGPENIFGFGTGPLTGIPGFFGSRFTVMGKSPLTGGWGDTNSGGIFGPYLKHSGFDAVFFKGVASGPVYLLIDDGTVTIRNADHLWGKDTTETEEILRSEHGDEIAISTVGPAGEQQSLISCIMHQGHAAARSGLGAVMGAKKLKAVVVKGSKVVPVPDKKKVNDLRKTCVEKIMENSMVKSLKAFGTSCDNVWSALSGDSPVKNWNGVGSIDFPNPEAISGEKILEKVEKTEKCWTCPIGCGAVMKAGKEYKYKEGAHRPEYESCAAFGPNCLNDNLESIIHSNDICDRYGLDTISTGAGIAFAIDCYENGILTTAETDGLELTWGNHQSIVALTEKIARREGLGALLADGVKRAAEKIGKGSEKFAVHAGGQELAMHDPRLAPDWLAAYYCDSTPGRHTQGSLGGLEMGREEFTFEGQGLPPMDKYIYNDKGFFNAMANNTLHMLHSSGICLFIYNALPGDMLPNLISAVTGWEFDYGEMLNTGERIGNVRQAFNAREGLTPGAVTICSRAIGEPPLKEGPNAGITVDVDMIRTEFYKAKEWDIETGKPSIAKLESLGLDDIAQAIWP